MRKGFAVPTLESPGECLERLSARVPGYIRLTFLSAVVLGLAAHLYMFANKFTNHDDLNQMFYADYGAASGRWLLPPVLRLDGNLSIPWLIGLLSILLLAGTACVTVSLLRIRQPLGCFAASALMVTFPTVTATFGYMFSADAYFLSLLLAAVAGYMLSVRLTTRNTGLTDYEGISSMGKLSLAELPRLVLRSYRKYVDFFLRNDWSCHFGFMKYAFILAGLATVILAVLLLRRRRLGGARTALAVALAAVYPLAGALIYVMVPGGFVHIHMLYGLVYILLAPLALADFAAQDGKWEAGGAALRSAASWVILLTMALTSYSYVVTANNAYLKADLGMRQCEAYSNRLLERVETCDGYKAGMDVVLVGSDVREEALNPTPEASTAWLVGIFDMGNLRTYFTYRKFLRYYLGFTGPVYTGESEIARTLAETEQVRTMPLYPEAGSVQVIDGMVVVKLND